MIKNLITRITATFEIFVCFKRKGYHYVSYEFNRNNCIRNNRIMIAICSSTDVKNEFRISILGVVLL